MQRKYRARVRIVDFPQTRVAALTHRGTPQSMPESVRTFIDWRKHNDALPPRSATFNIVYQHCCEGEQRFCHYDLCASIANDVPENTWGVVAKIIPAGRCAAISHTGSEVALRDTVEYLLSSWLPRSGQQRRDFPLFFRRVSFFPNVAEHEAVTEVLLPFE
jgi:AraC family transcriptional regulator